MASRARFRGSGIAVAIAAAIASAPSCDSPPPPTAVTDPGGTFLAGFLDFGVVAVGSSEVQPILVEAGADAPSPAVVHLEIEAVPSDAASDPSEFSLPDAGLPTAPCLIDIAFAPTRVAQYNHALLSLWFTAADGGMLDRKNYLLRGTSAVADGG